MKHLIKNTSIHIVLGIVTLSTLGVVYAAWNDDVNSGDNLTAQRWNDLVTQVESLGGGGGGGKFIDGTDSNDAVYTTGNVGIGTSTPTASLSIEDTDLTAIVIGEQGWSGGEEHLIIGYDVNLDYANISASAAGVGGKDLVLNKDGANVGIGNTDPQAKLDVNGEIGFGNTSSTCSATTEGQQRYNSTLKAMEYCDGSSWQEIGAPAGTICGKRSAYCQGNGITYDWNSDNNTCKGQSITATCSGGIINSTSGCPSGYSSRKNYVGYHSTGPTYYWILSCIKN